MILAEARDLSGVLDRTVTAVAELMGTKAASIRLIDRRPRPAGHPGRPQPVGRST